MEDNDFMDVEGKWQEFRAISQDLHLFCPKTFDDDDEDYDSPDEPGEIGLQEKERRIKAGSERLALVYHCSVVLGFPEEQAGSLQQEYVTRINEFLTTCAGCVRNWHRYRSRFLKRVSEHCDDAAVAVMEDVLNRPDWNRINEGLTGAATFIQEHKGVIDQRTFLEAGKTEMLIALYEALCCISYMSLPDNRKNFNLVFERVQQKRTLKLGEMLPVTTQFLFDEDKVRLNFARTSWIRRPRITAEDFDWAVKSSLEVATNKIAPMTVPTPEVQRYWEGFELILEVLDQDLVVSSLDTLDVQPSIYQTMLNHMFINSVPNLAVILKAFCIILQKAPKGLWGTFAAFSPTSIAEQVFGSPAFRPLLIQVGDFLLSMPEDAYVKGPIAIAWVQPFMSSIPVGQKGDVCDSIVHHFLDKLVKDPALPGEGQTACHSGAAEAMIFTLNAFLQPNYDIGKDHGINAKRMLNLTLAHKDVWISLHQARSVHTQILTSQTAITLIEKALMLDSRVTAAEFTGFRRKTSHTQHEVVRDSAGLWQAFLGLIKPTNMQVARAMLLATGPLILVEILRPPKHGSLTKDEVDFNNELRRTATVIGEVLERVEGFELRDLGGFCRDTHTVKPIVAALVNGEDVVNKAALSLIRTATDETSRKDAVLRLLELYFAPVLVSFTDAVNQIIKAKSLWSPQFHILHYSRDFLDALCDAGTGVLRSKTLTEGERGLVRNWWASQWAFIESAFNELEDWSKTVETETMKTFCRETMELADALLQQDGLISSALGRSSINGDATVPSSDLSQAAMKEILAQPRENCYGMAKMLRLKDRWLIEVTINVLGKLLRRLAEHDMHVPSDPQRFIRSTYTKTREGKYVTATNLTDQQRAELMKALGEDEDEVAIVEVRKVEVPKKQSKLDAWSRSGDESSSSAPKVQHSTARTLKVTLHDLTPASVKSAARLAQFRSKQEQKTSVKSTESFKESRRKDLEARKKRDAEAVAKAQALRAPKPLVPGEGSGLQGLVGVQGKDHAPQRSAMMVGSSSEDEDDEDSEDDAAFLAETQAGQKRVADTSQRVKELKLQQVRGPVKKIKIQRSKKDLRARLVPPMDELHQAILDWDIFHEGNDPPNGFQCSHVSDSYNDPEMYKATFFPLLVYDAWNSFVRDKDEATSKPFGVKVLNRMTVDKFIEVSTAFLLQQNTERWVSEGDLVLLSESSKPLLDRESAHCLARVWSTKIKNGTLEISYRLSGRAGRMISLLSQGTECHAVKIANMTPIEREYAALKSLKYYDLAPEILEAKPSPMLTFGKEAIENIQNKYDLNPGQAKAILNAKANDAFTLIQGPPGTGKTKTIVAMVGALMTDMGSFSNSHAGTAISKPGTHGTQANNKKLLVCAPSNAAVDELVLRLKQGVTSSKTGVLHNINVIRLGRSEAINAAVKDVTLDELVKSRVEGNKEQNSGPSERQKMHDEAGQIKKDLGELRPQLDAARAVNNRAEANALERKIDQLKRRREAIGQKIDADKDSGNSAARENELRKRQVQQEILDQAQVLCATLSGSGHEMFKNLNVEFETVIIDEAAQCVELSALIPLKYGCSKCILVGDPKQLPPTVLSQSAARYGYDQSLFVRMQRNHPKDVHLLDQQYRMHPEISQFPSQEFYEGRLYDGADMVRLRQQPWHKAELLGPYRFFDVKGSQETGRKGQSLINVNEITVAVQLYERFKQDNPDVDMKGKIGIITPYKAQLFELRDRFARRYGPDITEDIEFNTTDAFQGRECEIIIFSCVRASPTGGIGFMKDIRRMNVGLTRARSSLWILGDSRALVQGEFWNKLIENARARNRYSSGDILALLRKKGERVSTFDYSNSHTPASSTASTPKPEPTVVNPVKKDVAELEDVEMKDAPPLRTVPPQRKATQLPQTYTVMGHQAPPAEKFSNLPTGFSGIDEKGEAMTGVTATPDAPVIHPSGQKRRRDSSSDSAPSRKATKGFLPGKRVPSNPKNMPRPTDPSAMEVLGIAPTHANTPVERGQSTPRGPQHGTSQPVAPKPPGRPGQPNLPPRSDTASLGTGGRPRPPAKSKGGPNMFIPRKGTARR